MVQLVLMLDGFCLVYGEKGAYETALGAEDMLDIYSCRDIFKEIEKLRKTGKDE